MSANAPHRKTPVCPVCAKPTRLVSATATIFPNSSTPASSVIAGWSATPWFRQGLGRSSGHYLPPSFFIADLSVA
jgi:hypothetical protein